LSNKQIDLAPLLKPCFTKENMKLAKRLLGADDEMFKLIKEIFIDSKIKFCKAPVFEHTFVNINIIQELNTAQLKYIFSLIKIELEEREKKEKD